MEICIRFLEGQYGSNRYVPNTFFQQTFENQKISELRWKFLLKDNTGQTVLSLIQFGNKLLNTKKYMSFRWKFVLDP